MAEAIAGFVLAWSGIKGDTLAVTLKSLLAGKNPPAAKEAPPTVGLSGGSGSSGSSSGGGAGGSTNSALANDALGDVGHAYAFGGSPGPAGTRPWDCSSACNWWIGHDAGIELPGGSWAKVTDNGNEHGPNTLSYLAWTGAKTIGHSSSAAQAGDLCVWQTHMGIAIGGGEMVSALNEELGTQKGEIDKDGPAGELLFIRRIG